MARDTSNVFENFIAIRVSEIENEFSFISLFCRTNIAIKVTLQKKQFARYGQWDEFCISCAVYEDNLNYALCQE